MDVLGDSTLWSGNGDITTKEILKRVDARTISGSTKQYDTSEFVGRQENARPMATRVDTDPNLFQQERSVRPVQEPAVPVPTHQGTPPQKWRGPENEPQRYNNNQYEQRGETQPEAPENGQRREWRNSGFKPNNSVATGTG